MLKTLTLEDEEVEILLSYRKETLANLKKEIESLIKKHNHNEKRLNELTGMLGQDDGTSTEDHLPGDAHLHENGNAAAEVSHEPEAVHHHNGEASHDAEHSNESELVQHQYDEASNDGHQHEVEALHHHDGETSHEEGHSHENETVHHHDNETSHG
jgi:hypothetical protein